MLCINWSYGNNVTRYVRVLTVLLQLQLPFNYTRLSVRDCHLLMHLSDYTL